MLRQFFVFRRRVGLQLLALAGEVGLFGIGLRTDRDIFARRHRHRAGDQAGDARQQDVALGGGGGGDAQDQAGGRDDAVIGAQHGGAQPSDALDQMMFRGDDAGCARIWLLSEDRSGRS